jgi:hypothetical protein
MAYTTLEVERQDFNPNDYNLFHQGYQSLRLFHLKKEIYEIACLSNKVFIYYNDSELVLKLK